ncbi:MAG: hypothetical protein CVV02_05320 [Firmicutes bacterium HGW-Firmicutes-7]|nr:MAG: hypothetical protein CVV02_05320 [Firmicutes bacterium HGW-Firmicutes-7]
MGDLIVIIIVLTILGGASYKIYRDKKNNVKCSGCPSYKANGTCEKNK